MNIPDTVIFRDDEPMAWYFTSGGQIKAKSRAKLTVADIKASFTKHVSASGIVGVFMTTENISHGRPAVYFRHLDSDKLGRGGCDGR
jgi:hypothetical protein